MNEIILIIYKLYIIFITLRYLTFKIFYIIYASLIGQKYNLFI